jgi:hypothetical protein
VTQHDQSVLRRVRISSGAPLRSAIIAKTVFAMQTVELRLL